MIKDIRKEIKQIAEYLGVSASEEQIDIVEKHVSFGSMKKQYIERGNTFFMRKGEVGDWRNHFTPEEAEFVDKMAEEKLAGTGLTVQRSLLWMKIVFINILNKD